MTEINEKLTVSELNESLQRFGWIDYIVFLLMLVSCALIGVYFGFVEKKYKKNKFQTPRYESEVAQDYLMGGRQMSVLPVAISLVASWISGFSVLALTTEVYLYGTAYLFIVISLVISSVLIGHIYLPVFHGLQLTSLYEYLELRFDKRMRLFGSILYAVGTIVYLPAVIFVPALAFNQVTGINIHVVTPLACAICISYTVVGGIKAVVWTDCIQTILLLSGMIVIIVKGTIDVSGIETVWARNYEDGRLSFPKLTLDLTERHSAISLSIGGITYYVYTCIMGQSMMQRYLALPTIRHANNALLIFTILLCVFVAVGCYSGLLVHTLYFGCDPLKTKLINAQDQLLPLLVTSILGRYPGLTGLFAVGIFGAALSTLSTCLNSLAAVVLDDFYKPFASQPLNEKQTSYLMRGVVLVVGTIAVVLAFLVEHVGTVLHLSMSLGGVIAGPMFGVFTMGLMCPWVNKRGAFVGGIAGILTMLWIVTNAQRDIASGSLKFPTKPLNADNCDYSFAETHVTANFTMAMDNSDSSFQLHHISDVFYTAIGCLIATCVGSAVSLLCEETVQCDVDSMLFSPFVRRFINSTKMLSIRPDVKEKSCVIHAFETNETQF